MSGNKRRVIRTSPQINKVSEYRKSVLSEEVKTGMIVEGNSYSGSTLNRDRQKSDIISVNENSEKINRGHWLPAGDSTISVGSYKKGVSGPSLNSMGCAVPSRKDIMEKVAGITTTGATPGASVDRVAPEVYSPLYTMANLNLPRDRITVNAWIRNFFILHPIVRNAITLHATYPISKMNIKCPDKKINQFFEDMIEEMDLMGSVGDLALEYWKMGEAIPYGEWDGDQGKWSRVVIQNPDYIIIKKAVLSGEPVVLLRPDQTLKSLVASSNPSDLQMLEQIPEKILYHIRRGENIPLDNFNVSHLKMTSSPYDIRGTSIIVSVFKDLMLYDKIRECKFAQADGMINPITLIKVGGNADGDYRATQEDLEYFRDIFEQSQYDHDFKLVTHAGVTVDRVGFSGHVLEIASDMELIIKNIYTGLMVPPALIDSESSVYSSASIGLEVLRQRYFNFRNMLARWIENKIFAPVSEAHGFYTYEGGNKKLIIPEVEWNKMNLYDLQDYITNLSNLLGAEKVSVQTMYKSMGLSYEDEKVKMRRELIDQAIKLKEEQTLQTMNLNQLRTLDPEKPILETIPELGLESPPEVASTEEMAPSPGGDMGMDLGGGGGGEMPGEKPPTF